MKIKYDEYIETINAALNKVDKTKLKSVIKLIAIQRVLKHKIFVVGNGGSSSAATHFAQDLMKGTFKSYHGLRDYSGQEPSPIKAISLTDNVSFITATSNDDGYDFIFVNQLKTLSDNSDDILIVISGSGNSPNVVKAAEWARMNNLNVISFTGFSGGKIKDLSTLNINVHCDDMKIIESVHSILFHYIIENLQA